ncbi:MAG: hypothetical protein M3256_13765, partial [Actinomycetota bacterium]|nr:hypothetical protein [Actinomycetota bacterium]
MADPAPHPIETFRQRLAELRSYPAGVVPVPEYLHGTAFFSAAAGLIVTNPDAPLPPFPFGGVMFVGHNLDSETAFLRNPPTLVRRVSQRPGREGVPAGAGRRATLRTRRRPAPAGGITERQGHDHY